MRFELDIDGVTLEFTEPRAGGEHPWLTDVGSTLLAARAGHLEGVGVNEAASVAVELDNERKQAAALLGRPLRAPARLYDDDDELLLGGLVSRIDYGRQINVTVEA